MDEFLDDMDDEQVDDLLMPEEDETSSSQMYEHFRFVADKGQSLLRVDKFLVDRMRALPVTASLADEGQVASW